jgi:CheY-like chemotaxis protein/two-component sensor histidine kinase
LIDDILDSSRIISGKLRLELRSVTLQSIIESAVESIRPAASTKDIQLYHSTDLGDLNVWGDPERLQQVVWNLLSNAVKFTPPGGLIRLRLERAGNDARIIVSDTGQGIAPDFLPFAFEMFRQADSSSTRKHAGLGLGLAIVRHVVEMHGGTVRVESDGPGKGSVFTVGLPLLAQPAQAETSRRVIVQRRSTRLEGLRVLIVDDQPDARDLLVATLSHAGAEVYAAASAEEALTEFRRAKPDVILSDIRMPGGDGYALMETVRSLEVEENTHVQAAAITAYTRLEDRARAFRAGYQAHVSKPVDPDEVINVVATLAKGKHSASPGGLPS